MNHPINRFRTSALAVCALALPALAFAQATLAPQQKRIDDVTIQHDHQTYEQLQARIKALNDSGRRVADYHLAKAQCWLDVSFHEYTRNDRSAFPQAAMSESEKLIAAMETRVDPLPMDTPLVNGAARLRPDLWQRLQALLQGRGSICAAQKAACAEVELVHAGNEFNQQQWRHAKPYVQIAEDAIAEAETSAESCNPPLRAVAAEPVPPAALVPAAASRDELRVLLLGNLVFNFDRSVRADIRKAGLEQMNKMLDKLRADGLRIVSVKLVGHADRLNQTGNPSYNRRLSERRAATVRGILIERGIEARLIASSAEGDIKQVDRCDRKLKSQADLKECLLPNRRVEVVVTTIGTP